MTNQSKPTPDSPTYGPSGQFDDYDDFIKSVCASMDRNPFDMLMDPDCVARKLESLPNVADMPGRLYRPIDRRLMGNIKKMYEVTQTTGQSINFGPALLDDDAGSDTDIVPESEISDDEICRGIDEALDDPQSDGEDDDLDSDTNPFEDEGSVSAMLSASAHIGDDNQEAEFANVANEDALINMENALIDHSI